MAFCLSDTYTCISYIYRYTYRLYLYSKKRYNYAKSPNTGTTPHASRVTMHLPSLAPPQTMHYMGGKINFPSVHSQIWVCRYVYIYIYTTYIHCSNVPKHKPKTPCHQNCCDSHMPLVCDPSQSPQSGLTFGEGTLAWAPWEPEEWIWVSASSLMEEHGSLLFFFFLLPKSKTCSSSPMALEMNLRPQNCRPRLDPKGEPQ